MAVNLKILETQGTITYHQEYCEQQLPKGLPLHVRPPNSIPHRADVTDVLRAIATGIEASVMAKRRIDFIMQVKDKSAVQTMMLGEDLNFFEDVTSI
jgi:hypothetical protein